jgi:hypothetical protein
MLILIIKAMVGYWVIMWVRYTVMRIRIDQMLAFNWKFLTPLAFALVLVTALRTRFWRTPRPGSTSSGMFLANVLTGWAALEIARSVATHKEREQLEGRKTACGGFPLIGRM